MTNMESVNVTNMESVNYNCLVSRKEMLHVSVSSDLKALYKSVIIIIIKRLTLR